MNKTIKYCPYCGAGLKPSNVLYDGVYQGSRLGRFDVTCDEGHGSVVMWPDEDHDDDCECELHEPPEPKRGDMVCVYDHEHNGKDCLIHN